ncbi:MAG: tetratricopeptide repeat protein [Acidimicrobiales bacterium]
MPARNPSPRRASSGPPRANRGAPKGTGRTPTGSGAPRRPRDPEARSYERREARDGAERRIDRAKPDARPAPRSRGGERGAKDSKPYADRPRRYDRDSRDEKSAERRPRPSSAGRDGRPAARPGSRDTRARYQGTRPSRDGYATRDASSLAPRANDRRSESSEHRGRSSRPEGRVDAASRDRRPSLPPRNRPPARSRVERRPRELTPEELERAKADAFGRDKGWGGVARKGGANIKSTGQAMEVTPSSGRRPDTMSTWVQDERPVSVAPAATVKPKVKYALPGDIAADIRKAFIGTSYMREKMVMTLTKAAEAYDRKRYEEALRLGRIVADAVPGVAPVRELTGLAAYRAERWNMAKIHLRAHFTITGDAEHLPLVMDCDRANFRFRAVAKTFAELEGAEPSAEVLAEGRIVMAASLADQRLYTEAIELLTKAGATKQLRNPSYRHVRLWYALADVYDRAGDLTSARELFARVVIAEPDAYDAKARLGELGAGTPRKNRKRRTTPVSKKKSVD